MIHDAPIFEPSLVDRALSVESDARSDELKLYFPDYVLVYSRRPDGWEFRIHVHAKTLLGDEYVSLYAFTLRDERNLDAVKRFWHSVEKRLTDDRDMRYASSKDRAKEITDEIAKLITG